MAVRKNIPAFAEPDEDEVVANDEIVVTSDLKSARVKGTWTMYWGIEKYFFEDGKRYRLLADLFQYLKARGNIYDTL